MIKCASGDGGRAESGINDKRDCTVRAYAAVKGISYKEAHVILFLAGRRMRRGFRVTDFYTKEFGNPLPRPGMTVENYIKYVVPYGKYIIDIRGHVFAVIDGVIHDINPKANLNCHVICAWRVK